MSASSRPSTRRQSVGHRMATRSSSRKAPEEVDEVADGQPKAEVIAAEESVSNVYHISEDKSIDDGDNYDQQQQQQQPKVPSPVLSSPKSTTPSSSPVHMVHPLTTRKHGQVDIDDDGDENTTLHPTTITPATTAKSIITGPIKIALIVLFYFITSISVVFINKHLFVSNLKESTIFVTWVQLLFTAIVSISLSIYSTGTLGLSISKLLHTLPLSINFCLMLILNNLCLAYVHISFYQVARAWTVVMSMVLSFITFRIRPTIYQIICTIAIAIGYIMACDGEIQWYDVYTDILKIKTCMLYLFSTYSNYFLPVSSVRHLATFDQCAPIPIVLGLALGLFSSLVLAIYSIRMKSMFRSSNIDDNSMLLSVNTNSSIILLGYLLASKTFIPIITQPELWSTEILLSLLLVSAAGYLLNIATILQVKNTSALTHNVSGTAKASVQSLLGWWIYQNPVTLRTAIGTVITILGCGIYAMVPQGVAPQASGPTTPKIDVNRYPSWARCIEPEPREERIVIVKKKTQ